MDDEHEEIAKGYFERMIEKYKVSTHKLPMMTKVGYNVCLTYKHQEIFQIICIDNQK
jgi:hypothetical protein